MDPYQDTLPRKLIYGNMTLAFLKHKVVCFHLKENTGLIDSPIGINVVLNSLANIKTGFLIFSSNFIA